MQHHHLTPGEWDALANDPQFKSLLRARRRFVVPSTIFFVAFYLGLPLSIALAPGAMNAPVAGPMTAANLYGLLQFASAWVLLAIYMQAAKRFDEREREIVARFHAQVAP